MLQPQNTYSSIEFGLDSAFASQILAYPSTNPSQVAERVAEVRSLGIKSILSGGSTIIGGTPILGKGCVGLVVRAIHSQKGLCALKIRRIDADRADMSKEASFHSTANTLAVGPKLHDCSRNFMLMDIIEGEKIGSWASKRVSVRRARIIAKSILFQCHKLDAAGLDHGELSRISNHVLISGDSAIIVDFESASTSRKVSNVTSATQALFLYGKIAGKITAAIGKPDREEVLTALRRYKRDISMDSLEAVLKLLL